MSRNDEPEGTSQLGPGARSDVRVVAKGGAIQVTGQLMPGGLSFLFVAIAVRILGTADYGLFRQALQVLAIVGQVGLFGFNYSAMRYIARSRATGNPGGVRGAAWTALIFVSVVSGTAFLALLVGADPLAVLFADNPTRSQQLAELLRIGALFVPLFALTQVWRYCTQAYKTMVPSVIVGNIIQPAARFVLGVGFLLFGLGVTGVVAAHVAAAGLAAVAGAWFFRRMLTPIERSAEPNAYMGAMARFAFLQGGSSLLGVQTLGLAVLIVGLLGADREVGLMGIALALQTPGTIFLGGVVNIWAPMVTDLYERGEIERLRSLYETITRWIVTFSFPVLVSLISSRTSSSGSSSGTMAKTQPASWRCSPSATSSIRGWDPRATSSPCRVALASTSSTQLLPWLSTSDSARWSFLAMGR